MQCPTRKDSGLPGNAEPDWDTQWNPTVKACSHQSLGRLPSILQERPSGREPRVTCLRERPYVDQLACKLMAEIDPEWGLGDVPGHPKSSENRSPDLLGTSHGAQESPGSVPGASRRHLGASAACPGNARKVAKCTPERQKELPGASRSAPRRPKSTPSHIRG